MKIDADFQNLLAPPDEGELEQLRANLLREGRCRDAIVLWRGFIIDGYTRYAICREYDIPFETRELNFPSKKAVMLWITENQLGRRNLTDAARIELARKRALLTGGGYARKKIAKAAGLSEQTVQRYLKIAASGTPELIEQVRAGELKIGTAYKMLAVATTEIKDFFDDDNPRFKNHLITYDNVLVHLDSIGKLYQFIDEAVALGGADGMDGVCGKLAEHLARIRSKNVTRQIFVR